YLGPLVKTIALKDKYLLFGDNQTEDLLNKIKAKQNFVLDSRREVAQGIVAPQDFLNGAGEKKLNFEIPKGTGIFVVTEAERKRMCPSDKENLLFKPYYTTEQLGKFYGSKDNKYWVIYTTSVFKNP